MEVGWDAGGVGHGMQCRQDGTQEGCDAGEMGHGMGCRQDGMESGWDPGRTGRGQVAYGRGRTQCPPHGPQMVVVASWEPWLVPAVPM